MTNGITLTINDSISKKQLALKNRLSVTFSLLSSSQALNIARKSYTYHKTLGKDTIFNRNEIAALVAFKQKRAKEDFKLMRVFIKGNERMFTATDNIAGIKAAAGFTADITYVYELAVPLKYLGEKINNAGTFNYNILINGQDVYIPPGAPAIIHYGPDGSNVNYDYEFVHGPTDFWAKYTLAKKP